jgi:hypothetical protein
MNIADVRERVEMIDHCRGDDETAHSEEDKLRRDVLTYIADGDWVESDPLAVRDIAREALRTERIDFARWCA